MGEAVWIVGYAVVAGMGGLGVRLLLLARRTRELPELLVGLFFLASGPFGYLPYLGPAGPHLPASLAEPSRAVGGAGILVACIALCTFTWRVFRPDDRWAAGVAIACSGAMFVGWLDAGLVDGFGAAEHLGRGFALDVAGRLVAFSWAALEPFLYYLHARRRVRVGLADPVVVNRFLLWSIWSAASLVVVLTVIADGLLRLVWGPPTPARQLAMLGMLIVSAVFCGVAMGLTFFPPAAYRQWVRARAHAAA